MKKNFTYGIVIAVFVGIIAFIVIRFSAIRQKNESIFYALHERTGATSKLAEWATVKQQGNLLLARIKADPADKKSKLQLVTLFIQEARVTGDHAYYDKASMKYLDDVIKTDSNNFEALVMKSIIQMSQHHFSDGLQTATRAQQINPYNAFVYGMLVDGNVESGNYAAAVENSDKMVSIRPDLRSYSRISYLREIHGDLPGAIDAMKLAVDAGAPGDEGTEWCRVQLGKLFEKSGDTLNASMQYNIALNARPGYASALAGKASLETAKNNFDAAIALYQQAIQAMNDYSFKEELADTYALKGETDKATEIRKQVIDELAKQSNLAMKDESIGHYSDRELAYAYLAVNNKEKALEHAMLEYNRRPANIDVNEAVAWVHYQRGDFDKAVPFMKAALRTNSSNPTLLCRAALIYNKAGMANEMPAINRAALIYNSSIAAALRNELASNTNNNFATPVVNR
jgi:tetratricopeptide (TPR) repeat protein